MDFEIIRGIRLFATFALKKCVSFGFGGVALIFTTENTEFTEKFSKISVRSVRSVVRQSFHPT